MFELLKLPLMLWGLFNAFSGIVAGIWLLALGQWRNLIAIVAVGIASQIVISIAMSLSMILISPASVLLSKGLIARISGFLLALLGNIYVAALTTLWCTYVLYRTPDFIDDHNMIPIILASYGIATGPFAFGASRSQSIAETLNAVGAQIAFLITLCLLPEHYSLIAAFSTFGEIMLLPALASSILFFLVTRQTADALAGESVG